MNGDRTDAQAFRVLSRLLRGGKLTSRTFWRTYSGTQTRWSCSGTAVGGTQLEVSLAVMSRLERQGLIVIDDNRAYLSPDLPAVQRAQQEAAA